MEIEVRELTINTPPHSRNIQIEIMRVRSSGCRSVGIGWEDMILPGVEDPHNCLDPRNLEKSNWDQKLGKIECVFSLDDNMRWKWDDVYLLQGLWEIYSPSVWPTLLPLNNRTPIVTPSRCTSRPEWSHFGDAHGDQDWVNTKMHLEAGIERLSRCPWRPRSCEVRDALGGRDRASL